MAESFTRRSNVSVMRLWGTRCLSAGRFRWARTRFSDRANAPAWAPLRADCNFLSCLRSRCSSSRCGVATRVVEDGLLEPGLVESGLPAAGDSCFEIWSGEVGLAGRELGDGCFAGHIPSKIILGSRSRE